LVSPFGHEALSVYRQGELMRAMSRKAFTLEDPPQSPGGSVKVGMVSLGCPKNLVDSERMLGQLKRAGYAITPHADQADLLLINTCAFVQSAQEESIEAILEMSRYKEDGHCKALVVVGCLPQRFGPELADQMPEVDAWMGVGQIAGVVEVCQKVLLGEDSPFRRWQGPPGHEPREALPRLLCTPSHYAYLKIAEGCRNGCSYCVIPSLRGDLRSRTLDSLLIEAEELASRGVRELILVAQDLGNYGMDLVPSTPLISLLEGLCRIEGLEWIRLLYLHPAHVPDDLLWALATEPKICPYLDLPIQHIDDQVLKAMNRGVTSAQIRHLIERLRSCIPTLRLRSTVMVGFPGEDEVQFSALLDFIQEVQFDHLGAFAYSKEEGTPAARMKGQIGKRVKERRLEEVMHAQAEISRKKNQALVGTRQRVLIDEMISSRGPCTKMQSEREHNPHRLVEGSCKGRLSWQAPEIDGAVYVSEGPGSPGEFMEVKIIEADTYDLVGERLV